jgi:hypothetical protein
MATFFVKLLKLILRAVMIFPYLAALSINVEKSGTALCHDKVINQYLPLFHESSPAIFFWPPGIS